MNQFCFLFNLGDRVKTPSGEAVIIARTATQDGQWYEVSLLGQCEQEHFYVCGDYKPSTPKTRRTSFRSEQLEK